MPNLRLMEGDLDMPFGMKMSVMNKTPKVANNMDFFTTLDAGKTITQLDAAFVHLIAQVEWKTKEHSALNSPTEGELENQ